MDNINNGHNGGMQEDNVIKVVGARVHNLKNIDVTIPRDQLTVITGLSGSGKSSLAFDTIYAEGQRRYIETFSAYARNFIGGPSPPTHGILSEDSNGRMWMKSKDSAPSSASSRKR